MSAPSGIWDWKVPPASESGDACGRRMARLTIQVRYQCVNSMWIEAMRLEIPEAMKRHDSVLYALWGFEFIGYTLSECRTGPVLSFAEGPVLSFIERMDGLGHIR